MKLIKTVFKWVFYIILIPVIYLFISLIFSYIEVNKQSLTLKDSKIIYLSTNGIHSDIIIPVENLNDRLKDKLNLASSTTFCAFGWGEENFYLNTPNWNDLTFKNAFRSLFLKNNTLINTKRYNSFQQKWIEVKLSKKELEKINTYIIEYFKINSEGKFIPIKSKMYTTSNVFYKANGRYSCFKTCNSWVNSALKESGLKACFWTPFDFPILEKYQ